MTQITPRIVLDFKKIFGSVFKSIWSKMKKLLLFPLLSSLSQTATATIDSSFFQGNYECSGKELGTEESFKLIMTLEKTGETYSLKSRFERNYYYGTGIYDGANKSLSVVFINPADSKETGLIIFHKENKNKLEATWTYLGKRSITKATCKKI